MNIGAAVEDHMVQELWLIVKLFLHGCECHGFIIVVGSPHRRRPIGVFVAEALLEPLHERLAEVLG